MPEQETLNQRIKSLRIKRGLTQAQLAGMVLVTAEEIDDIEQGHVTQPMYILDLADALEVTPEYLQFGEGDTQSSPDVEANDTTTADFIAEAVAQRWDKLSATDQHGLWWLLTKLDPSVERRKTKTQDTAPPNGKERRR